MSIYRPTKPPQPDKPVFVQQGLIELMNFGLACKMLDLRLHDKIDQSKPRSYRWRIWNWLHRAVHEIAHLVAR